MREELARFKAIEFQGGRAAACLLRADELRERAPHAHHLQHPATETTNLESPQPESFGSTHLDSTMESTMVIARETATVGDPACYSPDGFKQSPPHTGLLDELNAVGPSSVVFTRSDIPAEMSLLAGIGDSACEKVNAV